MRFLWLALATAILVGTVMVMQRHRQSEIVFETSDSDKDVQDTRDERAQSCCSESRG